MFTSKKDKQQALLVYEQAVKASRNAAIYDLVDDSINNRFEILCFNLYFYHQSLTTSKQRSYLETIVKRDFTENLRQLGGGDHLIKKIRAMITILRARLVEYNNCADNQQRLDQLVDHLHDFMEDNKPQLLIILEEINR